MHIAFKKGSGRWVNKPLYRTIKTLSKKRAQVAREMAILYEKLYEKEEMICDLNFQIEKLEESMDCKKYFALTERERKIVDLRKEGKTLKEIAKEVGLTYGTLRNYVMKLPKDV